jgi:hypothetical protein
MKTCTRCTTEFPETLEYFQPNKNCKNGLNSVCRICSREYMANWKKANEQKLSQRRRELYAERYATAQAEKRRLILEAHPLRERAKIMRQGMLDRSRERGFLFDSHIMTNVYIIEWIRSTPNCPCCGISINYEYKQDARKTNASPSIDRIDTQKGYIIGNVALICWRCNNLKRDATADELEMIVRWMRSHE